MRKTSLAICLVSLLAMIVGSVLMKPATQLPVLETHPFDQPIVQNEWSVLPVWHPEYRTAEAKLHAGREPEKNELEDVQCPIPMKDRVKNYTGIQCVFASLECLGHWADCKPLIDPPITSRADCKSFSGPSDAAAKLKKLGVKFEMSYRDRAASVALIKKAMADGRATLFGVPGHAMVLCHYDDEKKKIVKYINNSNTRLPIETMSLDEFNKRWDTWVIVIYAEPDPFPAKAGKLGLIDMLPIIDRNNPQGKYEKGYIPRPSDK